MRRTVDGRYRYGRGCIYRVAIQVCYQKMVVASYWFTYIIIYIYEHIFYITVGPSVSAVQSPIIRLITKPRRSKHIIHIDQIHPLIRQRPPHRISRTNRPSRQIPIPHPDPLPMRNLHLLPQQRQLRAVKLRPVHRAELRHEIRARDRTDQARDIAERAVEHGDRRVVEIIAAGRDVLDLVEGRVARADDGDGAVGYGRAVYGGEIACFAEGVEGADDGGPGRGAVCFDVDPEVEGLGAVAVEDAVFGGAGEEWTCGVFAAEDVEYGVDVEGGEGAGGG